MSSLGTDQAAYASVQGHGLSKTLFVGAIGAVVVVLDQLTKSWIRRDLPADDAISVVPGFITIIHASNPGGAFSLFANLDAAIRVPLFFIAATFALGVLFYFIWQIPMRQRWLLFAVSGVLGGAIGNLIDRFLFGHVTDFVLVHYQGWAWPAFNVADVFISIGVVILIGHSIFTRDEPSAG